MAKINAFALPTWEERGGEYVRRLVRDFSITFEQAAGIVGNLGMESAGFTILHEIGQPEGQGGYGIAQWTGSRRISFLTWCSARNLDWRSDEANYGYLCEELRTTQTGVITALRKCISVDAATWSFGQTFERPAGTTPTNLPGYASRLSYARRAYLGAMATVPPSAQDQTPVPSPDPVPTPSPTPTLVTDAAAAISRLLMAPSFTLPPELKEALVQLQRIIDAIIHRCDPPVTQPDVPAPATGIDVAQLIEQLAAAHPDLDVRHSIVDLMHALGMPNVSLTDRRALAKELGVTGDVGTAEVNASMHKALLQKVADAGGRVPPELLK